MSGEGPHLPTTSTAHGPPVNAHLCIATPLPSVTADSGGRRRDTCHCGQRRRHSSSDGSDRNLYDESHRTPQDDQKSCTARWRPEGLPHQQRSHAATPDTPAERMTPIGAQGKVRPRSGDWGIDAGLREPSAVSAPCGEAAASVDLTERHPPVRPPAHHFGCRVRP